jgi:hypothetical protein
MGFTIIYTDDCYKWLDQLPRSDRMRVLARVDLIAEQGPGLGRPVVETIKASRHQNMKELRSGTIRVLFAFDPVRQAVLLIGGDKVRQWEAWYRRTVRSPRSSPTSATNVSSSAEPAPGTSRTDKHLPSLV